MVILFYTLIVVSLFNFVYTWLPLTLKIIPYGNLLDFFWLTSHSLISLFFLQGFFFTSLYLYF